MYQICMKIGLFPLLLFHNILIQRDEVLGHIFLKVAFKIPSHLNFCFEIPLLNTKLKGGFKRGSAIEVFYRGRALMELKKFFWPKTPKNMSKSQIWV